MTARNSASAKATQLRTQARKGTLWRRALTAVGVTAHTRRADAQAAVWEIGGGAEETTARMLAILQGRDWCVLHDRALPGWGRANLDHVLVSPCGTAVVVLDTKRWHAQRETAVVRGQVHCGGEDRHDQVEKVARYAAHVTRLLGMPAGTVWPLLVVHGSRIRGGHLKARAEAWDGVVHVLGPEYLVPTLAAAPKTRDSRAAAALARRVAEVLPPYGR